MPNIITKFPNTIGYCTLSKLSESVKVVFVDGLEAVAENISDDKYSLITFYYIITIDQPKKEVKDFIDFVLSDEGQKIVNKDFVRVK